MRSYRAGATGFHAFTLRYRLLPELFPAALVDARAGLDPSGTATTGWPLIRIGLA